jgi:hypothetical protein
VQFDLSICVPHFAAEPEMLQRSLATAVEASPGTAGAEIVLLPTDHRAAEAADRLVLPREVRVVRPSRPLTLVENWNRCLTCSTGRLIHILHDDDALDARFYESILGLESRFPSAALFATAIRDVATAPILPDEREAELLVGAAAAHFFLADDRHGCGNVVMSRAVVDAAGNFSDAYPYGPDEEAYLRWAAHGGVAFDPRPLYLVTTHAEQARRRTWVERDFGDLYARSRVEGAAALGEEAIGLSYSSTARRLTSTALDVADAFGGTHATDILRAADRLPLERRERIRVAVARAVVRSRLLLALARSRRSLWFSIHLVATASGY